MLDADIGVKLLSFSESFVDRRVDRRIASPLLFGVSYKERFIFR